MGWDINVYRMDFDRLLKIHGCRSEEVLQQMVSAYCFDEFDELDDEDEDYEEGDARLSASQALRNILFGEVKDNTPDPGYGDAVAAIYCALAAEHVGDLRVAAFGITSFFTAVDAVLFERGFPSYMSDLVMGGCPMDVPVETDGALGFLPPSECERFAREYADRNWHGLEPGLREAVDDLLKWCRAAAKHGHGLVSVGG